jgi:hypothetical protein
MAQPQGGGGGQPGGGQQPKQTDVFYDQKDKPILSYISKKKGEGKKPPLSITNDRNDTEYLRLTSYLYNIDNTPKTVFVLFYKLEVLEDDEFEDTSKYDKVKEENRKKEPIIARIFNETNQKLKDKLTENNFLALKIINPDNIKLSPPPKGQNKDLPGHNNDFTLEKGLKFIWDTDYHPFHWIKNKPRTKRSDELDFEPLESFTKDGKTDIYPILLVYKAGFPVMMYEGPYGDLNKSGEQRQVEGCLLEFIDIISKNGIPGVSDKEKWDSIMYDLWSKYKFPPKLEELPAGFDDPDPNRFKTNDKIKLYYNSIPKEVHKRTDYDNFIEESTFGVFCEPEDESKPSYKDEDVYDYIYKPKLLQKGKKEEIPTEPETKLRSVGMIKGKPKPKPESYVIEDILELNCAPNLKPKPREQIEAEIKARIEAEAKAKARAEEAEKAKAEGPRPQGGAPGIQGGGPRPQGGAPGVQGGGPRPQGGAPGVQGGGAPVGPRPEGQLQPRKFEQRPTKR